jgi:hypothetical protein
MKYAMLVYQAGLANVFEVDRFAIKPEHRNAKRLKQADFSACENFANGLAAAGTLVVTAACNMAGDIADREWAFDLDEQPFSDKFKPVDNLPDVLIDEAIQLIEKFPKYVSGDDDLNDVIETARMVEDRIKEDLASFKMTNSKAWEALSPGSVVLWPDNADAPYTKGDLVDLCRGNEELAFDLFVSCESGVCPETVIDEDSHEDEEDQQFKACHAKSAPKP